MVFVPFFLVVGQRRPPPSPPPPTPLPSPQLPPLFPGFRYRSQYYSVVQELYNYTLAVDDAHARCELLSPSAVATVEPLAFSLLDATACAAFPQASALSCTFTSDEATVQQFSSWVSTSPLEAVPAACVPMQLAVSGRSVQNMNPSPPNPPDLPSPPLPPPRPLPSPPPPPPSPPPIPPALPYPPANPPIDPPQPPSPPEDPPVPPSPPSTVQIATQNLCFPTCVQWALADGEADASAGQTSSCAGFFASTCSFDSSRFSDLLILPPQPSPPPMPPASSMVLAVASRVLASGGFDTTEMPGSTNPLAECTDTSLTPCVPADREHPWIMLDLSQQYTDIFSVQITLMPPAPPSPPMQPPPLSPSSPSTPPPPTPLSPTPSPPPPVPPQTPPIWCSSNTDNCTINNVFHHDNGICEDGLPSTIDGVINADVAVCDFGSDKTDCGVRPCMPDLPSASLPNLPSTPSTYRRMLQETLGGAHDVGWVEVFVSRQLASFGTRCATLNATGMTENAVMLRCHEDRDTLAEGRFVFVRSFESARLLRIDGVQVYRNPTVSGRRKLNTESIASDDELRPREKENENDQEEQQRGVPQEIPEDTQEAPRVEEIDKHKSRLIRLKTNMLNLTESVCLASQQGLSDLAIKTRREAALLWAELDEHTAGSACFDCVTQRPFNCTHWFSSNFGIRDDVGPGAEHTRRLREQLEEQHEQRRRALEDGLDQACCRVHKLTGERECSKNFCHKAIEQDAHARMGHILRRLHEKGHVEMDISQLVAVDVIAPHMHSDPRCRAKDRHSKKVDSSMTDLECLASSLATHIGSKHGVSRARIDEELGAYGLSIAKMLAQPLGVAPGIAQTIQNFKSNPALAELASKAREKNRLHEANRRHLARKAAPRGRALKRARDAILETPDKTAPEFNFRDVGTRAQKLRTQTHRYLQNMSKFASAVHKSQQASRAASLMPVIHSAKQETTAEYTKQTLTAIVNSDGSVVGNAIKSANSVSNLVMQGTKLLDRLQASAETPVQPDTPRRLSERTIAVFYDQVEARLKANLAQSGDAGGDASLSGAGRRLQPAEIGFQVPEVFTQQNGWIAGAIDWKQAVDTVHVTAKRLLARHEHKLDHIDDTGLLPTGELEDSHKTGFGLLDLNAPPSHLGNKLREFHAWVTNFHKSKEKRVHHARRMDASRAASRRATTSAHTSLLASAVQASVVGDDIFSAAKHVLEHSNMHESSRMRRLADTFLGEAASVPLLPVGVSNTYSEYQGTEGGVNYLNEAVRYIVYDTLLCYLYAPDETHDAGDFGDGTRIKTHRTTKLCFPGIPIGPTKMQDFRTFYGLGDLNFEDLEFEKACNSDAVKSVIGALGQDWASHSLATAPFGALLRIAEGIDSIKNLRTSGAELPTEIERGAVVLCGLSQLGGLIFSVLAVVVGLSLCVCAPVGSAVALYAYRELTQVEEARSARDDDLDALLSEKKNNRKAGVGSVETEPFLP